MYAVTSIKNIVKSINKFKDYFIKILLGCHFNHQYWLITTQKNSKNTYELDMSCMFLKILPYEYFYFVPSKKIKNLEYQMLFNIMQ